MANTALEKVTQYANLLPAANDSVSLCLHPGITLALISSMWMCQPFTRGLCNEPT